MTHTQRNVLAVFLPFLLFTALSVEAERMGKISEASNLVLATAEDSASRSGSSTSAKPHPHAPWPSQRGVRSDELEDLPFIRNKDFWHAGSCMSMMQTFVTLQPVRVSSKYIEEVLRNWGYGSGWFAAFADKFINTNDTSPWSAADADFEQRDDGLYWNPGIHFNVRTRHLEHHERLLRDCAFSFDMNVTLSTSQSCMPHKRWSSKLQDELAIRFDFHSKHVLQLMQSTEGRQEPGEDDSGLPYGAGSKYELLPLKVWLFLCVGSEGSEWTPVQMFHFSLSKGTRNASEEFWSDGLVRGVSRESAKGTKNASQGFWSVGLDRDVGREVWRQEPHMSSTVEFEECGPAFDDGPCVWKVRQFFKNYKTLDASSVPENAAATSHIFSVLVFLTLLATALPSSLVVG